MTAFAAERFGGTVAVRGARPDGRGMVFFSSRAVSREAARPLSHRALPLSIAEPAWRYGASAHAKLGTWDDVLSASVDAAAAAAASAHWSPPSSDVSILGTNTLADDFASSNGECSSLASAARAKSVFTYDVPKQCAMMMVCAGSPRAASTAHCMIAEHVLKKMMGVLASKDPDGSAHDQPQYTGYWNYHLHSLCDDGENCDIFDGEDRSVEEFEGKIPTMNGLDTEERKNLAEAMGEVRTSLAKLAAVDAESVVVVKTHEFDAHLMSACAKRLVLTSFRDKEEVFDSGLELGWFTQPKEKSRPSFDRVYDIWQKWRGCWMAAVEADPFHTRLHDLSFDALNSEDSFRAEVRRLAEMIMHVMNIREDAFSVDWIVDEAVKDDFQEELNPTMTNGNLPTEKEKAAEDAGAAEAAEAGSETTAAKEKAADTPVKAKAEAAEDAGAAEAAEAGSETTAAADDAEETDPPMAVTDDHEDELIEEAKADVVGETATKEVATEYDDVGGAVGEVVADNDAIAAQIEEITQNVEALEATTKAKEAGEAGEAGVSSSVPGDEDTNGADVKQGVVWTREEPAEKHGEKGPASRERADGGNQLSENAEVWVSGASGFDGANENDETTASRASF